MNQHKNQTIAQGCGKALTGVVLALRRDDRLRRGVAIANNVNRMSSDRIRRGEEAVQGMEIWSKKSYRRDLYRYVTCRSREHYDVSKHRVCLRIQILRTEYSGYQATGLEFIRDLSSKGGRINKEMWRLGQELFSGTSSIRAC